VEKESHKGFESARGISFFNKQLLKI